MNRLRELVYSVFRLAAARGILLLFYALLGIILSFPDEALANVYATNIRVQNAYLGQGDPLAISYILNEPASAGVVVEVLSDTNVFRTFSISSGYGTLRGTNTIIWDGQDDFGTNIAKGSYSLRITAKSDGFTNWTQISDDENPGNYVYEPRSIAINCNSNSPFYGRVFVGNSHINPSRNTEPGDKVGILKLNADGSPAEEGEFSTGDYPWAGDFFSPWKIEVSEDDKVYINDWTKNGVVIAFDQLISTNYQIVLSTNNWPIAGVDTNSNTTNYSNLSGPFITGSGTNTKVWMADISFNQNPDIAHSVGIRRWDLTNNGATGPDDTGTTIIQAGFGSDLNLYPYDVCVDKNGKIYVAQYRANPTDLAKKIFRFPAYDDSGNPELTADWKAGDPDYLVGAFGIAVNKDATLVGVALREGAALVVLDAETGTNVTTINPAFGHDRRDVAWDNVGNLYSVDNYESIWRAFSPPGTNQATTLGLQTFQVIDKPLLSSPSYDGLQFQALLSGETNFNYIIQSSTNLVDWSSVSTNYLTNLNQVITLEAADPAICEQFYRAVFAP